MKNEAKTDMWVYDLLKESNISLEPQKSSIYELNEAMKTSSKRGTKNYGFPEYIGVVKDYVIVIENKATISNHVKYDDDDILSFDYQDIANYAVNGAVHYAKEIISKTKYRKVIAFGISGDSKRHRLTPVYIDETAYYRILDDVETFISFNEQNIDKYYTNIMLGEETKEEKEASEILAFAQELHEDLRNYGNLKDIDKPLIVSGILLALKEMEHSNFSLDNLTGDTVKTDGQKIYEAIESNLLRPNVSPETKKDKILNQFSIIKDTKILNEINNTLRKTPLKHFTEFLKDEIFDIIKYSSTSEDYLGRFYGEFMSYSGGDGQTLGIVLTPKHITDLFCDLAKIKPNDVVLDPCCGTGGFLVAAMHHMLAQTDNEETKRNIKQKQLHGIELQSYMFTIATTNMILRGDGKSNILNEDFLKQNPSMLQLAQPTIGMINPPYSQGSSKNPDLYEISFIEHLLESMTQGGKVLAIVPQSTMTGKTKVEKEVKFNILKHHTLEGVITLNPDTFYRVGVNPCIALFTAKIPHPTDKKVKFINFKNDGYKVSPHIGIIETEYAKDKKKLLLDVWDDKKEATTDFCVTSEVSYEDEWLHSFYYFDETIPNEEEFEKVINDYLAFEFNMKINGKDYLFEEDYE